MELYEINNNGTLTVSFYKKSAFSNETHGFKLTGKNADNCIKALSNLNVKSFKQIGDKDLEVNYKKGKLIIRDYKKALDGKKFEELNYRINTKLAKVGPQKAGKLLTNHKYRKSSLVKKVNKSKSITNYTKKATYKEAFGSKDENYEFFMKDGQLGCTYSSFSRMTKNKFRYTYGGAQAAKTLLGIKGRVKEFQNLDGKTMEVVFRDGKVFVDDYNSLLNRKEFNSIRMEMANTANKLKHKDYKTRIMALNEQSKWVSRIRSIKNFGKKCIAGGTLCSFVFLGPGFGTSLFDLPDTYSNPTTIQEQKISDTNSNTSDDKVKEDVQDKVKEEIKEEPKKEVKEEPKVDNNQSNQPIYSKDYFEFNYQYRASSADNTRNNYQAIINKYSKRYGTDPELMLAIAAHERGTHSNVVDGGGAIGLMQIQVSVWDGATIKAHNYETGKDDVIHITLDKLRDVDFNIQVGTAIFQRNLQAFNYDIVSAIQAYNYGAGGVGRLIRDYGSNWLAKRNVVNGGNYSKGDHLYVEHVLSYLYQDDYNIQVQTPNGIKQLTIYNKALDTVKTR